MKAKIALIAIIVFYTNTLFSQNNRFEKGYFIDNNNKKVECLIDNLEWDYNPTQFDYKIDENASSRVMLFNDFQEFSVGEEFKFKKAAVKIDKSGDSFDNASGSKATNFVDATLLLRVRVEGKANLYSYKNEIYTRFFYSTEANPIQPLSFKVYYDIIQKGYRKNETYKQELFNNLKCEKITQNDIERLEYTASNLSDFFIKYNTCSGALTDKFVGIKNHETIELYAKAGLGISSFSFDFDGYAATFSKKANFKLAVEAEINLSNKLKKWSLLFESTYLHYSDSYTFDYTNPIEAVVDYKSLDLSVGLRRYFDLNSKSALIMNGYLSYGMAMNSSIKFSGYINNLEIANSFSPSLGLGYIYDRKYLVEFRYQFSRDVFPSPNVKSKFSTIGFMLGYKFL